MKVRVGVERAGKVRVGVKERVSVCEGAGIGVWVYVCVCLCVTASVCASVKIKEFFFSKNSVMSGSCNF